MIFNAVLIHLKRLFYRYLIH